MFSHAPVYYLDNIATVGNLFRNRENVIALLAYL